MHRVGKIKTSVKATGWEMNVLLKGLFQLFHDSPVRRSDNLKITSSTTYPEIFCTLRWVEDAGIAETDIAMKDNVVKMFEFW